MNTALLVSCLFAANPSLTLVLNGDDIRQCDHLVIKAVLHNRSLSPVTIERQPGATKLIRIDIKADESWTPVALMSEQFAVRASQSRSDPILEPDASYAEYDVIMLRGKAFVFETVGRHEFRAVAYVSGRAIESESVAANVRARGPMTLRRIRSAIQEKDGGPREHLSPEEKKRLAFRSGTDVFAMLGTANHSMKVPRELANLEEVGGNLGTGVSNLLLTEKILAEERVGDDAFALIRSRMDAVNAEIAFHALGHDFHAKRDWHGLRKVVESIPDKSMIAWEWYSIVELHLPVTPRLVVPQDAPRQ